jgi:hypothetical protein
LWRVERLAVSNADKFRGIHRIKYILVEEIIVKGTDSSYTTYMHRQALWTVERLRVIVSNTDELVGGSIMLRPLAERPGDKKN